MTHTKEIKISKNKFREIAKLLTWGDKDFGEDSTITETAVFDDGFEMSIKCCGVKWEECGDNTAWTEAVLFEDAMGGWVVPVSYSEPSDHFLGEWKLSYGEDTYIVNVVLEGVA